MTRVSGQSIQTCRHSWQSHQEEKKKITYQHADCLVKEAENLQIRVRGPIQEDGDGMPHNQRRQIQRILGSAREIAVELVVHAIPQVGLLEERPLRWGRLSLGEKRSQSG